MIHWRVPASVEAEGDALGTAVQRMEHILNKVLHVQALRVNKHDAVYKRTAHLQT